MNNPRGLGPFFGLLAIGFCRLGLLMRMQIGTHGNAARHSWCKNNLKQIVIALQNYHDDHGSFPPAYIPNENGKPMHSWRVLLLPYLDRPEQFAAYDFSQPWDSVENLELLEDPPPIYVCPTHSDQQDTHFTSYVAVIGERTAWPGAESSKFRDFLDGPVNTILVMESHVNIPWTEPRDLDFDEAVAHLTNLEADGFEGHRGKDFFREYYDGRYFAFADGVVHPSGIGVNRELAVQLLTLDDGKQELDLDRLADGDNSQIRIRWKNVILSVICVLLTILPLPWVWINPTGNRIANKAELPVD